MSIVAAAAKIGDDAASAVGPRVLAWRRPYEGASVAEKREAAKLIMDGYVQGYDDVAAEFARNDAFRSLNEMIVANVGRDRDKGAMLARVSTGLETCMFGPGRAAAAGIGRGPGQGLQGPLRGRRQGVPQMGEALEGQPRAAQRPEGVPRKARPDHRGAHRRAREGERRPQGGVRARRAGGLRREGRGSGVYLQYGYMKFP